MRVADYGLRIIDNRFSCKCASGECDKAEAMVAAAKLGTDFRLSTSAFDTCGLARLCDFRRHMARLPITTAYDLPS